jgi:hypothetical protein
MPTKMKQRQFNYRAWDAVKKVMCAVRAIHFSVTGVISKVDVSYDGTHVVSLERDFSLMLSTGQLDASKNLIFEDDLVDFYMDHPRSGWIKVRGRVIWNESLSYGPVGFLVLDETNSVHQFSALDNIVVVGNMYLGVKK